MSILGGIAILVILVPRIGIILAIHSHHASRRIGGRTGIDMRDAGGVPQEQFVRAVRASRDSILRAKLEFGVMRSAFDRAHVSWSHAPADLKPALLLRGQTLARAESWLYDFPEKLGDSEKSFIMASVAKNSMRDFDRINVIDKVVKKSSSGTFWLVVVTFFLIVRLFIPMVIEQVTGVSVRSPANPAPAVATRPGRVATAPGNVPPMSDDGETADPDAAAAQSSPGSAEPAGSITPEAAQRRAAIEAQRLQRLHVDLARGQIEKGRTRTALLLALEIAYRDGSGLAETAQTQTAASLIAEGLTEKIAALPVPAASNAGPATLFCDVGRTIIAAAADRSLRALRADGSLLPLQLQSRPFALSGAAVSGDCDRVALAGDDHTVEIWSLSTGKRQLILSGHEGEIRASAFSPDGLTIATVSQDGGVRLWDGRSGRLKDNLEGHDWEVSAVAFSADGNQLATASSDKTVRVWDIGRSRKVTVLSGHAGPVTQATFSPDGRFVLSTALDGFAFIWEAATGKLVHRLNQHGTAVMSARFSPDGSRVIAIMQDGAVTAWHSATAVPAFRLETGTEVIRDVAFAADGHWLLTLSWGGNAALWSADNGRLLARISHADGKIASLDLTERGRRALAVLQDGTVASWPLFGPASEAIKYARAISGGCLQPAERIELGLAAAIPDWCEAVRPD